MPCVIILVVIIVDISFKKLESNKQIYKEIYEWCQNEFVYEWFEQRRLSLDDITRKYEDKISKGIQSLFIIQYDNKNIGLVQIYKFKNDIKLDLKSYKRIYEYDLFIGIKDYLSKGIGTQIVHKINDFIFNKYKADAIILRPFKRNIRAIKCYEKNGFKKITEYNDLDTIGNQEIMTVLLKEKNSDE